MDEEDADHLNSIIQESGMYTTEDDDSQTEGNWQQPKRKRPRFSRPTQANNELPAPIILQMTPRPSEVEFGRKLRATQRNLNIKFVKLLRNPLEMLIQPGNTITGNYLNNILELKKVFENTEIKARRPLPKQKSTPSFVITNVSHTITEADILQELKEGNNICAKKVSRIQSRATGSQTKLIRVITTDEKQCNQALQLGVKIGFQKYRCEPSKSQPTVQQCFKCQGFGHIAKNCTEEQKCLRCSGSHPLKECKIEKSQATCANCGGNHASVFRGCPSYQEKLTETAKNSFQKKYSTVAAAHTTTHTQNHDTCHKDCLTKEDLTIFIADLLTKLHRANFQSMQYSDIINYTVSSSSKILKVTLTGQQIHDSMNPKCSQKQSQPSSSSTHETQIQNE